MTVASTVDLIRAFSCFLMLWVGFEVLALVWYMAYSGGIRIPDEGISVLAKGFQWAFALPVVHNPDPFDRNGLK